MRKTKQIIFGLIILTIFSLFGWGIYSFVKPAPTCFDGIKNQNETDVDCGGPCVSCDLKSLKPIQVGQGWPKWFRTTPSTSGIIAEIYNPNPDWGAWNFLYKFEIKDQFGSVLKTIEGKSFIYGGELKYLIEPRVDVEVGKIASANLVISNPQWAKSSDFPEPNIEIQDTKTEKSDMLYVEGKVINRSESDLKNLSVYALVYNKDGQFLSASKTIVDSVPKFSSSVFKISFGSLIDLYKPISFVFSFSRTLKLGDSGEDVGVLQSLLLERGLIDRQPTNYFDQITSQSLAKLQGMLGVTSTGELDQATLKILNEQISSSLPQITKIQEVQSADPSKTKVFVQARK